MKVGINLLLLFLIFNIVRGQLSCLTGNWGVCAKEVATRLLVTYSSFNTWQDHQEINLFGTSCTSAVKGGIYRWQWRWQGRFWCPALSTMEGSSRNWKSRNGAIEHAIEDYVRKGGQHGFLTAKQLTEPSNP